MTDSRPTRDLGSEGFPVGTTEFSKGSPASDGWHDAVLAEIVDLGVDHTYRKEGDHRGALVFQLDEIYPDGDFAGQSKEAIFYFSFDQGMGSSEKGTQLRSLILEGWKGAPFTAAEKERMRTEPFRLAKLVGRPLRIMTAAKKAAKSERMFNDIIKTAPANADPALRLAVSPRYVPWHDRKGREEKPADVRGNTADAEDAFGSVGGGGVADDSEPPF